MSGDSIKTQWKGVILLGGPSDKELELREKLFDKVYEWLSSACERFDATSLPQRLAYRIAHETPYHVTRTRKHVVEVKMLEVNYRNPPVWWKQWIRVKDDEEYGEPGKPA